MSGGPRKFSEKIALLNLKQQEGNAAFDSIMVEVKSIKSTSNSGSQLDMLDPTNNENEINHTSIEEAIARQDEYVNVTYEHPNSSRQQSKKSDEQLKINTTNPLQHPMLTNNAYLTLPGQNDSFRRAHSDSSINHTATSPLYNSFPQQSGQNMNLQQQQQSGNYSNLQQAYNLEFQQIYQQQQAASNYPNQPVYYSNANDANNNPSPYDFNNNSNKNNDGENNCTIRLKQQQMSLHLNNTNSVNSNLNSNSSASPSPTGTPTVSNLPILLHQQKNNCPNQVPMSLILPASLQQQQQLQQNNYYMPKFLKNESAVSNAATSPVSPKFNYQSSPDSATASYPIQNMHQYGSSSFQSGPHNSTSATTNNKNTSQIPNNSLLNPNVQVSGGSLPDLTAFQYQTNPQQQLQLLSPQQHYIIQQQISPLHHNHQGMHLPHVNDYCQQQQQQQNLQISKQHQYDLSSQLLQPNFHQHAGNIGPVKSNSVSPTRGMSRYSPTSSSCKLSTSNRRPSPQRIQKQMKRGGQQQQQLLPQTTPTSPQQPSFQNLPSLEFTINTSQVNTYMTGGAVNGAIYRNSSNSANLNGANLRGGVVGSVCPSGESLPPSPQSQHSCFNSPQGSPDPLSISPHDINPFTANNLDIMHKKFDSFNLDTSGTFNGAYVVNGAQSSYNQANVSLQQQQSSPSGIILSQNLADNANEIGVNGNIHHNGRNNSIIDDNAGVGVNVNGANIINSRSGSISSSESSCNQVNNNGLQDDIEFYQQQQNRQLEAKNSYSNSMNKRNNKSVPDIVLTLTSFDGVERNFSNITDIIKNDESFDLQDPLDLQMMPETANYLNDEHTINNMNNNIGFN